MSEIISVLREVHRLRRHAKELQDQIDRVPRQLQGQQAKVARQEDLLKQEQEAIKRLKITIHEKEVSLKSTHQQIDRHREQLNQSQAKKEYDALHLEIARERQASETLEEEVLTAMGGVEERTAKLPELEQTLTKVQEEAARFERDVKERQAGFLEQLQRAQAQLKEVELRIPEEVRTHYDRLVAARGEDSLATIQNRICSACYTEVTMQMLNDLLASRMVACKSCGRLLYLSE